MGGGVCLLINSSLKPHLCSDLMSPNCERVWVNCKIGKYNLIICCHYRPPYCNTNTLPQLDNSIALASRSTSNNSKVLVMGDFDTNLLDSYHIISPMNYLISLPTMACINMC